MTKVHFEHGSIEFQSIRNHQNIDFFLSDYEKSILLFIKEWFAGKNSWTLHTSGSTGKPKRILLYRNLMEYSAKQTVKSLKLHKKCNALLAINAEFVGGIMMIVRCLVHDMNLIVRTPSSRVLDEIHGFERIDFAAFVPLQIDHFLADPNLFKKFSSIGKVIIGGAPLADALAEKISDLTVECYQTYGMTETYSHVALKKVSSDNQTDVFQATGDVKFHTVPDGRLVINGTITGDRDLVTNDIVKIHDDKSFTWIGRYDNIINSGGVKISPESVELKIAKIKNEVLAEKKFFISSKPDKKFGEKLVLYIEGEVNKKKIVEVLTRHLPKYEIPREIISKTVFTYTDSGKINRLATQAD